MFNKRLLKQKDAEIASLKEQLQDAKNLKYVLETLADKTGIPSFDKNSYIITDFNWTLWSVNVWEMELPDKYLCYEEDILWGKVIKQEANKCIIIDEYWNVDVWITKQDCDKWRKYKLVQK